MFHPPQPPPPTPPLYANCSGSKRTATDVSWLHTSLQSIWQRPRSEPQMSAGYTQVFQSISRRPRSEPQMSAGYTQVFQSISQRPRSEQQMSAGYTQVFQSISQRPRSEHRTEVIHSPNFSFLWNWYDCVSLPWPGNNMQIHQQLEKLNRRRTKFLVTQCPPPPPPPSHQALEFCVD